MPTVTPARALASRPWRTPGQGCAHHSGQGCGPRATPCISVHCAEPRALPARPAPRKLSPLCAHTALSPRAVSARAEGPHVGGLPEDHPLAVGGWAGLSHLPRDCAIGLVAKTPGREKVPQRQGEGGADMPRPLLAGRSAAHKLPERHGSMLHAPPPTHSACCQHFPWWPSLHPDTTYLVHSAVCSPFSEDAAACGFGGAHGQGTAAQRQCSGCPLRPSPCPPPLQPGCRDQGHLCS